MLVFPLLQREIGAVIDTVLFFSSSFLRSAHVNEWNYRIKELLSITHDLCARRKQANKTQHNKHDEEIYHRASAL